MERLQVWGIFSLIVLTAAQKTTNGPHPQPSYLLLAPKALQHGIPTSISVTILIPSPVTVSAHIVRGNLTMASQSVKVEGGSTTLLTLPPISDSEPNHWEAYILEVKGHRGEVQVFSSSTKLHLNVEDIATFIQTDKVMYLPGQTVKIRIVSIHSDGKPFISPVDIIIRDPRGNLLRQWLAADSVLGVVSKEFQLSENPPLGQWTIIATVKVSPLAVLPKFEVLIDAPDVIYREDPLEGSITAKYTYGKPVQGHLNMTFIYHFHGTVEFYYEDREIDGTESFTFDAPDYFQMRNDSKMMYYEGNAEDVTVVAHVTEYLTGRIAGSKPHSDAARQDALDGASASFEDSHSNLYIQRSYTSPSESYLQIQKPFTPPEVKSRGQAISAGKGSPDLTLVPEVSWAPLACIIVYCVHPSGEVINDAIQLPIRQFLQNQVSLSWSSVVKRPAETVTLNVSVLEPNSVVGILVVDKATQWAGSDNDITTDTVMKQMKEFGNSMADSNNETPKMGDPHSVFKEMALTVPDSITTWIATAFVMSENLGLGIVEQPAELTVFQDFFLSLNLPAFIIRGEELLLEIILFNYLQEDQKVNLLLLRHRQTLRFPFLTHHFCLPSSFACPFILQAEGLEQSFSTSLLLELLPAGMSLSRNVTFTFPPDVVEGSERASVMAVGYERELTFQRGDGSFSAFGEQDSSGSTWLSAFVLRCFLQARPFINIDSNVLHSVAAWIASQQGHDGSFLEPGRVIHTELQGGLDGPVSLTAYVLIALLEDASVKALYETKVSAAVMYLETHLALGVSSNYSLSLLTYALALAGSSKAQSALNNLTGRAEIRDGVPMWFSLDDGLSSSWQPRSSDIEMASYVLLSHYKLNSIPEGLNLMKWLSQQRNHRGGFGSTQDTVVALQALSMFAARIGSHDTDVTIRVDIDPSTTVASFQINNENYLLHQSQQITPEESLILQVTAEGRGLALFQLNVFYNVRNEEMRRRRREAGEQEAFELYVELVDSEENSAHLYICTRLVYGLGLSATGMAIMEVGLLSGFSLSPVGIETNDVVKKVETQLGKVILYLDSVTTLEMCVQIPLIIEYKVAKVQEATVVIYDYYEPKWSVFEQDDLQTHTTTVLGYIKHCMDTVTTEKRVRVYPNRKPWMTSKVQALLKARNSAYKSGDLRKTRTDPPPLSIKGDYVEKVSSFKFLGTHISEDLSWSTNTSALVKKAQQHLHFLRVLRRNRLQTELLVSFYRATIESVLVHTIPVWYAGCTTADKKRLQRVIRTAEKVIGCPLPSLDLIASSRCLSRARAIIKDHLHPNHHLFNTLPSGKRLRSIRCWQNKRNAAQAVAEVKTWVWEEFREARGKDFFDSLEEILANCQVTHEEKVVLYLHCV
ncbi:CD109 antigen [Pundamilia nyererei]|uniref:CD109 antigen n=1 Tax=Pundamilia nyererei TaxID=303518 RepID=A0A9Y6JDM5_9CICH|nr:PREDICTED: CD109 antigen [Pundamilia nyererei]